MLRYTNINQLSISEDCPLDLIAFLDPSVEYLRVCNDVEEKSCSTAKYNVTFEILRYGY